MTANANSYIGNPNSDIDLDSPFFIEPNKKGIYNLNENRLNRLGIRRHTIQYNEGIETGSNYGLIGLKDYNDFPKIISFGSLINPVGNTISLPKIEPSNTILIFSASENIIASYPVGFSTIAELEATFSCYCAYKISDGTETAITIDGGGNQLYSITYVIMDKGTYEGVLNEDDDGGSGSNYEFNPGGESGEGVSLGGFAPSNDALIFTHGVSEDGNLLFDGVGYTTLLDSSIGSLNSNIYTKRSDGTSTGILNHTLASPAGACLFSIR